VRTPFLAVLAIALVAWLPDPVSAQESDVGIIIQADARIRYEFADVAGQTDDGEALTLRIRSSVEVNPIDGLSLLAEGEAIASLLPDRLNGFVSGGERPGIADQETVELNRLQVEFAPMDRLNVTLGRQRIALDDERFIGIVDFRQNQQTYDAITASIRGPADIAVRAGYIWRVGRILGGERRDGVFDSDSFFVNAALPLEFGQIGAFHYDLDLDDRVGNRIESQTSGATFRGRSFPGEFGLFYEAGYARQESAGATPEYVRAKLRIERGEVSLEGQFELLGSDRGVAFQTPLATLHRFQGATDIFLVTPPDGIEDIEIRGTWRIGSLGTSRGASLSLQYNTFSPAVGSGRYGEEWGAEFGVTLASTRLSVAASHYDADNFASDTTRVWLTAARKF
ncbi:MAG: alginate export family protein, partial [Erythrobacter sp.]|nr:alginate export family protein [Erythrobacter sp.]